MNLKLFKADRPLLIIISILTLVGFVIFISASLGLHTRETGLLSSVLINQTIFGLLGGIIALIITSSIHYRFWRKHALWILLIAMVVTLLVFVPKLGLDLHGAKRWISVFGISFQPSELLKIGAIIYFAAWLSGLRDRAASLKYGLIPLMVLLALIGGILLSQPDTDTFLLIAGSLFIMYIVAGAKIKHILILVLLSAILVAGLAMTRPYIKDRLYTYVNPTADIQGSSWQIQQSLIAIGSGGLWGRGFGQSVQKFTYLPEPIGDSVFAVASEEFGFIGSSILVLLYVLFGLRAMKVAVRAPDTFGRYLVVGITVLIVTESFMNIAAMLGLIPLTGIPLLFVSHGGSALLFTLAEVGIILNISKYQRTRHHHKHVTT